MGYIPIINLIRKVDLSNEFFDDTDASGCWSGDHTLKTTYQEITAHHTMPANFQTLYISLPKKEMAF